MGSTTIDRVLQVYEFIDKVSAPMDRLTKQMQAMDRVHVRINRGLSKVSSTVNELANKALTGFAAIGGGALALGKSAFDTAVSWEQLNITMESLIGNADKADQKMRFIKQLAIPSTFTSKELAVAGTQLEAFGVPLEKALINISKLGAAFPNKELGDFVSLYGRLASGDFPDLESLSGVGLSKLDFMKQGIKFDAQGSLLSGTRETMDALDRIVNDRYGTILERIANSTSAKLATVRDKWDAIMEKIGNVLIKYIGPALDRVEAWISKLSKNDGLEKWMKDVSYAAVGFVGSFLDLIGTVNLGVAGIAAALGNVPGAIAATASAVWSFAKAWGIKTAGNKVLDSFWNLPKMPKSMDQNQGFAKNLDPLVEAARGLQYPDNPALKTLNDIEGNTRQTADNTRQSIDFKRYALGGGDIAGMGIQAIDRYRGRGLDRNRSVTINAGKGKVEQAMAEVARDAIEQYLIKHNGGR